MIEKQMEMVTASPEELLEIAVDNLRHRYYDDVNGGIFDFADHDFGLKKLLYNAACAIGLLQIGEDFLFRKTTQYLVGLAKKHSDLVPTWQIQTDFTRKEQGTEEFTLGEQGILLWALSAAKQRLDWSDIETQSARIFGLICDNIRGGFISHYPGHDYFVPMSAAFCLDGLIEYYHRVSDDNECRKKIGQLVKYLCISCSPPVFFIKKQNCNMRKVYFNNIAYPIHAIARYCLAFEDQDVQRLLQQCVERLMELQGPLGQWWWIYSPEGKVAGRYPVYSVHQHGMAVMALKMARKVVDPRLSAKIDKAIHKSYGWVSGGNELGEVAIDRSTNVMWRSVEPKEMGWVRRCIVAAVDRRRLFDVTRKSRSYEYGWLLYAGGLR